MKIDWDFPLGISFLIFIAVYGCLGLAYVSIGFTNIIERALIIFGIPSFLFLIISIIGKCFSEVV